MKTRISPRKDAGVLVVTRKQPVQFDLTFINAAIKALSNLFTSASNFFNRIVKNLPDHHGTVNKADQYSESVIAREPAGREKPATQTQPIVMEEAAKREHVKVISSDGMHVGIVERVFADSAFDQITHLLISREIPSQDRKLIPIKWVQTMGDATVHLRVTKDLVEELADASIIW
jgi:hypothetical protein